MRNLKPTLIFFSLLVFFGGGLLLTKELMDVRNTGDYVVMQVLTMMNGLGLVLVLFLWLAHMRSKKADERDPPP